MRGMQAPGTSQGGSATPPCRPHGEQGTGVKRKGPTEKGDEDPRLTARAALASTPPRPRCPTNGGIADESLCAAPPEFLCCARPLGALASCRAVFGAPMQTVPVMPPATRRVRQTSHQRGGRHQYMAAAGLGGTIRARLRVHLLATTRPQRGEPHAARPARCGKGKNLPHKLRHFRQSCGDRIQTKKRRSDLTAANGNVDNTDHDSVQTTPLWRSAPWR